jgi:hypothetical protein
MILLRNTRYKTLKLKGLVPFIKTKKDIRQIGEVVMKKSQMLTVMGLLTAAGIVMVAAGLMGLSQDTNYSMTQAWNALWEQHTAFAWVASIYCVAMLACDAWFIIGMIAQAAQRKQAL